MLKPGYQQYGYIENQGNSYIFHNFRDFTWIREDEKQPQHRIQKNIDSSKIVSLDLYISPFALYNLIGHTILSFGCSDEQTICLSVESELKNGEKYNIIKSLFQRHRIRYIRGSEKDLLNLRIYRQEKLFKYKVHIPKENIKDLFIDLVQETNKVEQQPEKYNLIANNCTSGLRKIARNHFSIPKRHYSLLFNRYLPNFLQKLGVIKINEKIIQKKIV